MAISIETSKNTVSVGKGRTKRDLVTVAVKYEIPTGDNEPAGQYLVHEVDTGATSDDTFGLKLLKLELVVMTAAAAAAVRYCGAQLSVGLEKGEDATTAPWNLVNKNTLETLGSTRELVLRNGMRNPVYLSREVDQDMSRIMVVPKLYLNSYLSSPVSEQITLVARATFEKVAVTKQEYLDKMLRGISR